jgi:hypothetical protein
MKAEQENAKLALMKAAAPHMNQFTLLMFTRWVLYRLFLSKLDDYLKRGRV